MPKKKTKVVSKVSPEVEEKRADFGSLSIDQLKDEAVVRKIDFTGMQTRTKIIDAILEYEEAHKTDKVEIIPSDKTLDKARDLTDYDQKQINKTPQFGKFQVIELKGGRTVIVNKQNQVVTPIAVTTQEKSDHRVTMRNLNMKDAEQKPENQILADTPKFAKGKSASAPAFGDIREETTGRVAEPVEVNPANRGKGQTQ